MPERFSVQMVEADQRLDKLLRQRFPNLSFGQTQKLIRGGRVRVDGRRAKAADRIAQGAVVTLPYQGLAVPGEAAGASEDGLAGLQGMQIWQDDSLVAIHKPTGLAVQGGSQVQRHVAGLIAGSDLRLVHRLDRDTSGLLILARGALMAKKLAQAFADHGVQKTYLALVPETTLDQGRLDQPLKKILQGGEGRMTLSDLEADGAQTAVTDYRVLNTGGGASLVQLQPQTGRTHQLRVHCAHAFGGIYGDPKYGKAAGLSRGLKLHAWQVRLNHPLSGEPINLEAPLPAAFLAALSDRGLAPPKGWSPL